MDHSRRHDGCVDNKLYIVLEEKSVCLCVCVLSNRFRYPSLSQSSCAKKKANSRQRGSRGGISQLDVAEVTHQTCHLCAFRGFGDEVEVAQE